MEKESIRKSITTKMKRLLLIIGLFIVTQPFFAQPKLDLVTYQKMYMKSATATKDTTLTTDWAYYKFTIAPTETDSVIYWSFNNFGTGDSMKVTYPQVWNQPDWLDAKVFPRIVVKGASDYIIAILGRQY